MIFITLNCTLSAAPGKPLGNLRSAIGEYMCKKRAEFLWLRDQLSHTHNLARTSLCREKVGSSFPQRGVTLGEEGACRNEAYSAEIEKTEMLVVSRSLEAGGAGDSG